jgi:hypothetical protein
MYKKERGKLRKKKKGKRKQKAGETSSLLNIGQPCFHTIYMSLVCSKNDQELPFKGATDGSELLNIYEFLSVQML